MNKEQYIAESKQFRKDMDDTLQRMKSYTKQFHTLSAAEACEDVREVIANHTLSIRHLEDAIMRQGMTLKAIGNPTPYPSSYDPSSPVVEPTADGLKL